MTESAGSCVCGAVLPTVQGNPVKVLFAIAAIADSVLDTLVRLSKFHRNKIRIQDVFQRQELCDQ